MNFPQNFLTFLASIAANVIQACQELYQQTTTQQPEEPWPASANIDFERSPEPQLASHPQPSLAVQNHQQWQNGIIAFCFSYALGISLQHVRLDQSNHDQLPFSFVLLSFLVLLTFIFNLVAFFIHPTSTQISQALQKIALFLAAAAFCHALSIPLSFELKCATWALFFIALLIAMIFTYLNTKMA